MQLLNAKPVVDEIKAELRMRAAKVKEALKRAPRLAVVLVGEDPASVIYTRRKGTTATELGFEHETLTFPADATVEEVHEAVIRLNHDPKTDGILIQRPLPKHFPEQEVLYWVNPEKDVDAFHPINSGRLVLGLPCFAPCTPAGVIRLLKYYQIQISGKLACIIGRSSSVGKPMAALLMQENATILHCHSKTRNLPELTKQADLLIVAAGRPHLIDRSYVREGAVVVDVGIHRTETGRTIGDVAFDDVAPKTSAITPVPGGVGPMTIAILLTNTVQSAEMAAGITR